MQDYLLQDLTIPYGSYNFRLSIRRIYEFKNAFFPIQIKHTATDRSIMSDVSMHIY